MAAEPPTTRLFELIDAITAATTQMRTGGMPPRDLARLWRVVTVADAVSSLRANGRSLPADAIKLATLDAEAILTELGVAGPDGPSAEIDLEFAARLADRLMESVGYIAVAEPERADCATGRGSSRSRPNADARALTRLAERYEARVASEHGVAARTSIAALVLLVMGAAVAVVGIETARGATGMFHWAVFAGYALVGMTLVLASLVAIRVASRHTAASREAWSIQCQLEGLDEYLAPIPAPAQALIRATLVQRIFPPPREGDEPWREPRWPDAATLMAAIDARDAKQERTT